MSVLYYIIVGILYGVHIYCRLGFVPEKTSQDVIRNNLYIILGIFWFLALPIELLVVLIKDIKKKAVK